VDGPGIGGSSEELREIDGIRGGGGMFVSTCNSR